MSNCILWFLSDGHKKNPNWQNPTILTLYLSDRHQAVVVDGHVSSVKPITAGVPQREQAWSFVIHHLYQWYRYWHWEWHPHLYRWHLTVGYLAKQLMIRDQFLRETLLELKVGQKSGKCALEQASFFKEWHSHFRPSFTSQRKHKKR